MTIEAHRPTVYPTDASTRASPFATLSRQVVDLGLMRRSYGYYWAKMIIATGILAGWLIGFLYLGDSWWQLISAVALAVVMAQIAFLGHDAAHRQIFKSGVRNDWASLLIANLVVGISHGWWRSKHNRHHANPNREGLDPDIALSAVTLTPDRARRRRQRPVARWLVDHQGWYFVPLLLLEGVSLHANSVRRVLASERLQRRWLELSLLAVRLVGLVVLTFVVMSPTKAVAFLGVELTVFGFYLGASFAPNHIGMPLVSSRLKLDFIRRQVLVSRNIAGGRVMSAIMGGLNYQIEHHLFPSMPRNQLPRLQPLVADYCAAHNIPYQITSLTEAYRSVIAHLNTVGLRGRDPYLCPLVQQRREV